MAPASVTFRLDPRSVRRLDVLASQWRCTRSDVLRSALDCVDLLLSPELLGDPSVLSLLGSKAELAAHVADALATAPAAKAEP